MRSLGKVAHDLFCDVQQRLLARAAEPQASLRRRPGAPRARGRLRPSSSASACGWARSRHRAAPLRRSSDTPPTKSWLGMLRLSRSRNMPVHYTTLDERAVARVRAWRLDELLFCVVFRCEDVNRQRLGSARPNTDARRSAATGSRPGVSRAGKRAVWDLK